MVKHTQNRPAPLSGTGLAMYTCNARLPVQVGPRPGVLLAPPGQPLVLSGQTTPGRRWRQHPSRGGSVCFGCIGLHTTYMIGHLTSLAVVAAPELEATDEITNRCGARHNVPA